jgi:hypothetical protein
MNLLLKEIRHNPLLWLLVFVPVVFAAQKLRPEAHTLLFVLSVLAIVPLAALLSHATESVAAKTGDTVGGLLNATLGNLTELVIALTALRAGQYTLVKASIDKKHRQTISAAISCVNSMDHRSACPNCVREIAASAHGRSWHQSSVRGTAAIPSGYGGTCTVVMS